MNKSKSKRRRQKQPSTPVNQPVDEPAMGRVSLVLLVTTAFFGAFLLFLVQPLVGKAILPWFGGSPAMWTTSMFFFQLVLLAGYCYVHVISRYSSVRTQILVHAALAIAGALLLPIYPSIAYKPTGETSWPAVAVLQVLTATVGVQFFLLATTAPLTQVWWHRISNKPPYSLYAVSNCGSLLALFCYPFVLEPALGVRAQALVWSASFVVYVLLVACCLQQFRSPPKKATEASVPSTLRECSLWLFLSCGGSVLLLAITNHVTQNVAVVPFFWVLPLAIYLISFILVFSFPRSYHRPTFTVLMAITFIASAYFYDFRAAHSIGAVLVSCLATLFVGCMIFHGELVKHQPAAEKLTAFYVMLSAGGALGGFLVSFVAPSIFSQYYEYPITLVLVWLTVMAMALTDRDGFLYRGRPVWGWAIVLGIFVVFLVNIREGLTAVSATPYFTKRNFYGVLSIEQMSDPQGSVIALRHGTICHGAQYLQKNQFEPTTYFTRASGMGTAMKHLEGRAEKRVGILGLGIGTVAAYCEPGDYFRAYEIDPDVVELATNPNVFTFWTLFDQRQATADIVIGDARTSLENELANGDKQDLDLLLIDVFTGDAIPVHLITQEAFTLYSQHLKADGVIAVHISNRHLDLVPVVLGLADQLDQNVALVIQPGLSRWAIVAPDHVLREMEKTSQTKMIRLKKGASNTIVWTDDFSDILSVLR
jgi:hypothetical protein